MVKIEKVTFLTLFKQFWLYLNHKYIFLVKFKKLKKIEMNRIFWDIFKE